MKPQSPRFYDEFAEWWPLFSPPDDYVQEAADLWDLLGRPSSPRANTLLELGSGGGSLASHLASHFKLTLTDRSSGMLAVSQRLNPECEHVEGDMRTLRLGREFDVVLIHDAIMYATSPDDVRAALTTAARHCRPHGIVCVLPDVVRETFAPGTEEGGHDAPDGRGLRYLEWTWDPDPHDETYVVDYAFLLRDTAGSVQVVHDRHVEGLFPRESWLRWFREAGLPAECSTDRWNRNVFLASPAGH